MLAIIALLQAVVPPGTQVTQVPPVIVRSIWEVVFLQLPSIILNLAALITAAFGGWKLMKEAREHSAKQVAAAILAAQEVKLAAHKVAENVLIVKDDLSASNVLTEKRMLTLQNTADDTHTLVNNQMAIQLNIGAIAARALALAEPTPANMLKSEKADQELINHMAKQAKMDKQVQDRKDSGVNTPSVEERSNKP